MGRLTIPLVLLTCFAAAAARAQDDYPIYVYPCPQAETPPTIDGLLDEAAWESAPVVGGFTLYDKPEKVEVQTFFRVLWDPECLYFGIECDEPALDTLTPLAAMRDAKRIFADEAIEIFVDPDHDHSRYFQFGINAAGSLFDGLRSDPSWNSQARLAPGRGERSWLLEVAIPWRDLTEEAISPGRVVGFNVCRDRHLGAEREWTNWSQTKANFHDPARFAHLVLSPTPAQLAQLAPKLRQGDRSGPIAIFSKEGFAQTTYAELAKQAFGEVEALIEELKQTQKAERDATAARLLGEMIERKSGELTALRAQLEGGTDAATWTRTDMALQRLSRELRDSVWEARLSALLSQI